jgi:predicted DNA-binding transcriptional regulator YafY
MPPLLLDDEEVVAVAVGLRTAASTSIEGIEETALRAFAKLDQLLPSRLRKRVGALQSHVEPLYWRPPDATVDPESLAVFSMACRDREQVRFDYTRRDGDEASRLVEPFQLVSTGRRWYLAAWDVRRDDWRTFRLDRLHRARLAGGRCAVREIPGGDAAAYVAQSLRSMPQPSWALLEVGASADDVRAELHWGDTQVDDVDAHTCRARIEGGNDDALVRVVTWLAGRYSVAVLEPASVVARVDEVLARVTRAR